MFRVHQVRSNLFKKGNVSKNVVDPEDPIVALLELKKVKLAEEIQLIQSRIDIELKSKEKMEEFVQNGTDVSYDDLIEMAESYQPNGLGRAVSMAVQNVALSVLDKDPEKYQKLSARSWNVQTGSKTPSNQMYSGRCWMFAGLNVLVRQMINMWNLKPDFELSQSYLFFWHYVEQYNDMLNLFFKEDELKNKFNDKRREFLEGPLQDGANWINFIRLVKKYGVVPKSLDGESFATVSSAEMKSALSNMISNDIYEMEKQKLDKEQFKKFRDEKLKDVVHVLCTFMGAPPTINGEIFEIETKVPGKNLKIKVRNPQDFFSLINKSGVNFKNVQGQEFRIDPVDMSVHVQIINDVREDSSKNALSIDKTWYTTCYQKYQPQKNLLYNIKDMKTIVNIVLTSLKMGRPVWFACNMNTDVDTFAEGMDNDLYQPELFLPEAYKYKSKMKKADRMDYGLAHCNHAMLIVSAETKTNGPSIPEEVIAFEIENSWGSKGRGGGFYKMTKDWFVERAYTVVVHPEVIKQVMQEDFKNPGPVDKLSVFPLGDFFG